MNTSVKSTLRLTGAALRALLVLTVITGVLYPLLITGVARTAFSHQANGSPAKAGGKVVGSELIGRPYNLPDKDGGKGKTARPDPAWFQSRPSASDYDPLATGSSQLGTSDPRLVKAVEKARKQVAAFNHVPLSRVPADAVTGSASALDPDISPAYARIQAERVAHARGLDPRTVEALVKDHTQGRAVGFLGQEHVNVLDLNLALRKLDKGNG